MDLRDWCLVVAGVGLGYLLTALLVRLRAKAWPTTPVSRSGNPSVNEAQWVSDGKGGVRWLVPAEHRPKPTPAPPAKVYPTGRCVNENPNPAPAGPPPVVVTRPGAMR